jgi:hypothetical protein
VISARWAKVMNRIFNTIYIVCALLLFSNLQGEEDRHDILVSIAYITSAEQSSSDTVQVGFKAHEPSEIRGSLFYANCDSKDRAKVRSKYPLSGLFIVSVSEDLLNKLKKQKEERERDQLTVDTGIDPRMISNLIMLAEVKFSLIEDSIREYTTTAAQPVDGEQ